MGFLADLLGGVIKNIIGGIVDFFKRKKLEEQASKAEAAGEAIKTVGESYDQQENAENAGNEAADNTGSVGTDDGGVNFDGFNADDQ